MTNDVTLHHRTDNTYVFVMHMSVVISNAGLLGIAPVPGSCVDSLEDSHSCSAEVVRGGSLELCVTHKKYPPEFNKTVTVDRAGWSSGNKQLVGCETKSCTSHKTNYNSRGEWGECLSVVNVTENDTVTYWIRVDPDTEYPSDSPVSMEFNFKVQVVDPSESQQVCVASVLWCVVCVSPV